MTWEDFLLFSINYFHKLGPRFYCFESSHYEDIDGNTYERANNVHVKKILFWVKSLQNFTLFCPERE